MRPEDLGKYDHVPQLEIGMNRVLVSDEMEKGLKVLREDHESGAQALAVKALNILLESVRGDEMAKLGASEEFWREVRWRAWHLAKNGRPSMGAAIKAELFKALHSVQEKLEGTRSEDVSAMSMKSIVESAIEARIEARQHSLEAIADNFVKFVRRNWSVEGEKTRKPYHVVTLSSSGTITQCLRALLEQVARIHLKIKLSVLESRPNFEGVSFVNNLLQSFKNDPSLLGNVKIEITSDASIASVFGGKDDSYYLVLGADSIYSNGDVSNKIGSLAAAATARSLDIDCKIVAVFDSGKIGREADRGDHPMTEYNDPAELMDAWPSYVTQQLRDNQADGFNIEVKNAYFELVPYRYIDRYITEGDILERDDLERLGGNSKELEDRLFGDL